MQAGLHGRNLKQPTNLNEYDVQFVQVDFFAFERGHVCGVFDDQADNVLFDRFKVREHSLNYRHPNEDQASALPSH
jgi:hypothetical protein